MDGKINLIEVNFGLEFDGGAGGFVEAVVLVNDGQEELGEVLLEE